MKRLHAVVRGRVQGVGYRVSVQKRIVFAEGVTGYIKNLPDGTVEIVAEGSDEQLKGVLSIAGEGSRWSIVSDIKAEYADATGEFPDFIIAY